MSITVSIDPCISFLIIAAGLDFVWCGYLFLTTNDITRLPRLLGYLMFKLFERMTGKDKQSNDWAAEFGRAMFSLKAAGVYSLLGGLSLIVSETIDILIQILFSK